MLFRELSRLVQHHEITKDEYRRVMSELEVVEKLMDILKELAGVDSDSNPVSARAADTFRSSK